MSDLDVDLRKAVRDAYERERVRALQLLTDLRQCEADASCHQLTDPDWQADPVAVRYRALLRDWWQLPSVPAMAALYDLDVYGCVQRNDRSVDVGWHFRRRCLTKAADDRVVHRCTCRTKYKGAIGPCVCSAPKVRYRPGERAALAMAERLQKG